MDSTEQARPLYQFSTTGIGWPEYPGARLVAWGRFANDDEAIAWFVARYPEHYRRGIDMQVVAEHRD